ncbi:ComF family protein [Gallaecimonas mangrovi]|uniref:ComF family protein n=1 Tax=Gallaecimonas mangrovi TaxID=2291597 RepID=UPI000E1FE520|nr:ComF family protein [Gallaecimonas mangrovi]
MTSDLAQILARAAKKAKPQQHCWLCLEASHTPLCHHCIEDLVRPIGRCKQCGEPGPALCSHCRQRPPPFDEVVAGFAYEPPFSHFIHRFKYQRQWWLDSALCQPLLAKLQQVDRPECLLPVPMHWSRRLWRGFNQAELLARYLGKAMAINTAPDLLRCTRAHRHQQGLTKSARQRNLNHAYRLTATPPSHVAIVDDVMTTGATVSVLAKLLKQSGCHRVQIWCLARA